MDTPEIPTGRCRCNNCGEEGDEIDFVPTDGRPDEICCPKCESTNVRENYCETVSDDPLVQNLFRAAVLAIRPPDDMTDDEWLNHLGGAVDALEKRARGTEKPAG